MIQVEPIKAGEKNKDGKQRPLGSRPKKKKGEGGEEIALVHAGEKQKRGKIDEGRGGKKTTGAEFNQNKSESGSEEDKSPIMVGNAQPVRSGIGDFA